MILIVLFIVLCIVLLLTVLLRAKTSLCYSFILIYHVFSSTDGFSKVAQELLFAATDRY